MYNNFDKKQKILIGVIIIIIIGFLCYYVYARDEKESIETVNNLEIENENSDEFILVHVSGAVNKEGIVELKTNSRIADAIDKVRRIKRRCLY